ncbi:MAG: Hpt domain-containing protein [Cyanobacteria bacterium P01_F01_bin.13]
MITSSQIAQAPPHFLQEASELLQQINHELQTLHQDFCIQKVHTLMRLTHTLKGAAATVGLEAIKTTSQSLENAFKALCVPDTSLTSVVEELIFDGYGCLKLLLSAQVARTQVNESEVLDKMADIVSKLQENLGDRFGQNSYLPTSTQLGVDVTQSVFESGVSEYLEELSDALVTTPQPAVLAELLQAQAEVFIGLAESLGLPGFGEIAEATLAALNQYPNQSVKIAQLALADYRTGQAKVLRGDRAEGGSPSVALKQLGNAPISEPTPQTGISQNHGPPLTAQMQPLSKVFQHCRQDLARLTKQQGKPVNVQIKKSAILVDEALVKQLCSPLLQLVRYAFTQDIEPPVVRRKRNKPAVGKIQLAAKQAERYLVICVWDNGCGKKPAIICQQVQPAIEALQGRMTVAHCPGKGTCFTLKIPTGFYRTRAPR